MQKISGLNNTELEIPNFLATNDIYFEQNYIKQTFISAGIIFFQENVCLWENWNWDTKCYYYLPAILAQPHRAYVEPTRACTEKILSPTLKWYCSKINYELPEWHSYRELIYLFIYFIYKNQLCCSFGWNKCYDSTIILIFYYLLYLVLYLFVGCDNVLCPSQ